MKIKGCNLLFNTHDYFDFEKEAYYMGLDFTSVTPEMDKFLDELMGQIQLRKLKKNKQYHNRKLALEAICADLLLAHGHNPEGWCYRSIRKESFSGERIGYKRFDRMLNGLIELGYIQKTKSLNRALAGGWMLRAPRVRATPKFLALAHAYGVECGDRAHFKQSDFIPRVLRPITLRSGSFREGKVKVRGRLMKVSSSLPIVQRHKAQMDEINTFLYDYKLTLSGDPANAMRCKGLHRIFNCGDKIGHGYQKGGRLYPISGDYQVLAGKTPEKVEKLGLERKYLLIDGEEVAEIDIGASHPRILLAKLNQTIDESTDPYEFEGIPRKIVKIWFTMTMGHHGFHKAWKPDTRKDYAEANPGHDLSKDYPIKKVEAAVLARYPVLAGWPTGSIRWGDLQYIEAQIIVETLLRLVREHGIPAYPVHDSIIVPVSKVEIAKQTLRGAFKEQVGVYPALSVKGV